MIAPVDPPPREALARIEAFVRRGGSLIVLDDSRIRGHGSTADYLGVFGVGLHDDVAPSPRGGRIRRIHLTGMTSIRGIPSPEAFVAHRVHGAGHVVFMRDAAAFSRSGMGHCFARPWKTARARYETIFAVFRDLLRLVPADRRYYGILDEDSTTGRAMSD